MGFFKNYKRYRERKKLLTKIYEQENLAQNLSQLIGANFKIDNAGRMYGVFNPFLKDGRFAYNEVIYEYNVAGMSFDSYVEKILMEKMNVANSFIVNHQLFDLVTYNIEKLDEQGNYLFTITPLYFDETVKSGKRLLKWLVSLAIIGGVVGGILAYIM